MIGKKILGGHRAVGLQPPVNPVSPSFNTPGGYNPQYGFRTYNPPPGNFNPQYGFRTYNVYDDQASKFAGGMFGDNAGNVDGGMSWWDKLKSNIDKDFLSAALGSLGDFGGSPSRSGGGGGGGGGGRGGGGNVQPAGFLAPVLPDIPAQAPNPGFYTLLPRQQKDRYSGGF